MAYPDCHFLNSSNSCAIDSFLELAQFTFYKDIHNIKCGSFLNHVYDVCTFRERYGSNAVLNDLREAPWQWLERNAATFRGRTANASFEEILDFMSTTPQEQEVFSAKVKFLYDCNRDVCTVKRTVNQSYLPLYTTTCDSDLERAIDNALFTANREDRTCLECGHKGMTLIEREVSMPNYLFVRVPTLVSHLSEEPTVVDGIVVKEIITLGSDRKYRLVGAVRGKHNHFSLAVIYNGKFVLIDDTTLNIQTATTFSELTGQINHGAYTTKASDGFFMYIYEDISGLQGRKHTICYSNASLPTFEKHITDTASTPHNEPTTCTSSFQAPKDDATTPQACSITPSQSFTEQDNAATTTNTWDSGTSSTSFPSTPTMDKHIIDRDYRETSCIESCYSCTITNSFSVLDDELPSVSVEDMQEQSTLTYTPLNANSLSHKEQNRLKRTKTCNGHTGSYPTNKQPKVVYNNLHAPCNTSSHMEAPTCQTTPKDAATTPQTRADNTQDRHLTHPDVTTPQRFKRKACHDGYTKYPTKKKNTLPHQEHTGIFKNTQTTPRSDNDLTHTLHESLHVQVPCDTASSLTKGNGIFIRTSCKGTPFTDLSNKINKPEARHEHIPLASSKNVSQNNQLIVLKGRPYVDVQYFFAIYDRRPWNVSTFRKHLQRYGLDPMIEMYPYSRPTHISLYAFIYCIFRIHTSPSVKMVSDYLLDVLNSVYAKHLTSQDIKLAGYQIHRGLDDSTNVFLAITDCFDMCGFQGKSKRYIAFTRAMQSIGLDVNDNFLNLETPIRHTHMSLKAVVAYLISRSSHATPQMQQALSEVFQQWESSVIGLPIISQNTIHTEGTNFQSSPSVCRTDFGSFLNYDNDNSGVLPVGPNEQKRIGTEDTTCSSSPLASQCSADFIHRKSCKSSADVMQMFNRHDAECGKGTTSTRVYNKTMHHRISKQQTAFQKVAKDIHHGDKDSFKTGLLYDISISRRHLDANSEWSGSLSTADLLDVLDHVPGTNNNNSFLKDFAIQKASKLLNIDARSIINIVDCNNSNDVIKQLRKSLGGIFPKESDLQTERTALKEEFETILKPTVTPTGFKIDPARLLHCLRHLYFYIPDIEYWKLWGDAREIGSKKSCMIAVSCINHELSMHGIKYHSPKDIWPVCIFYGGDGRWSLESNVGGAAGSPGWLNDWVHGEQCGPNHAQFFLSGDSMWIDAVHGMQGELAPTSNTGYNIYSTDHISTKHETSAETGFRSGLVKNINRDVPNSLLPTIPLSKTVFCIDHATTRIVEKLIQLRLQSIVACSAGKKSQSLGKDTISQTLQRFKENMIDRMVMKAGRLEINADGSLKERLTLNKRDAHSLLLPCGADRNFGPLLEGVASTSLMINVDKHIQNALNWPPSVSEFQLESAIFEHLSGTIFLLRKSDPPGVLKPGCKEGSIDADDYVWGLNESDTAKCIRHLDLFHKLFVARYGGHLLTPYMIKLVDVTRMLFKCLPFRSLMRFSTEGGEHMHYMDSCYFHQHTQRGGAHKTEDPMYAILLHRYRLLQHRLLEYSKDSDPLKASAGKEFLKWVQKEKETACSAANLTSEQSSTVIVHSSTIHNFLIVGRTPGTILKSNSCKSKEEFIRKLQSCKSRVIEMPHDRLPSHELMDFVVLTQQSQCDLDKPTKTLLLACQKNWCIVDFSFCTEYFKDPASSMEPFLLRIDKLKQHPSAYQSAIQKTGREQFIQHKGTIHPVTQYKKTLKTPTKAVTKHQHPWKRPGSGYVMFYASASKDMPSSSFSKVNLSATQTVLSSKWKLLTDEEKAHYYQLAKDEYARRLVKGDSSCVGHFQPAYLKETL